MISKIWSGKLKFICIVTAGLIIAAAIKSSLFELYVIPTESMEPTIMVGDRILVSKAFYSLKVPFFRETLIKRNLPRRGQIVIARYMSAQKIDFVKRIIGLPGDKVQLINNELWLNDQRIAEPYIQLKEGERKKPNFGPVTIPEGQVFLMGDNRNNSVDGRILGFAAIKDIKGRALFILWSNKSIKKIFGPV